FSGFDRTPLLGRVPTCTDRIAAAAALGDPRSPIVGARFGASRVVIPGLSRDLVSQSRSRGVEESRSDEIPRQARGDGLARAVGGANRTFIALQAAFLVSPALQVRADAESDLTSPAGQVRRVVQP